jgi:hypothetical protein
MVRQLCGGWLAFTVRGCWRLNVGRKFQLQQKTTTNSLSVKTTANSYETRPNSDKTTSIVIQGYFFFPKGRQSQSIPSQHTIAPSDCQWPKKCEGRKWMMIAAFPRGEMPRQSKNPRILCVKNRTPCAQIFIDHPSRCLRLGHVAIRNCQNTQWKIYWNSE